MKPFALAAAAAALAACASTPDPVMISAIEVQSDLSAVGSREAVGYWQTLDTDLEAALAAEFVGRTDPSGRVLTVDIDEITLTNALTAGLTAEDARLAGRATLAHPDGSLGESYDIVATAGQAASYLPPDSDVVRIEPTSADFYAAIVRAFARGTAEAVVGGGA